MANHINLKIDGSFNNETSTCGFSGLFRDSNGIWVLGFQGSSYGLSPLHGELMALKKDLQLAREQGFTNIDVETDSTDVILCLQHGYTLLNNIIHDCRLLMHQVKAQTVEHNFREANKPAHKLAKDALRVNNGRDLGTLNYPPYFVTAILAIDYEATTYLVKNIRKDACTKLASLGNKNVLRDFLILCNSQVGNAPLGNFDNVATTF
ncbi:PREDICTED: uncharacterized protein LOC109235976 [Nicotiana attenuata]|uniref:uncharacterized protein LOC109235976 n=1 Tax=Nicotiana attenuata TaxID=49451 RepID=UPI0009049471|nr:PREDICTED: uncharacterized protein LOC109235976 [Nicotiana attenuata]